MKIEYYCITESKKYTGLFDVTIIYSINNIKNLIEFTCTNIKERIVQFLIDGEEITYDELVTMLETDISQLKDKYEF